MRKLKKGGTIMNPYQIEPHVEGHIFRLRKRIFDFMTHNSATYQEICNYLSSTVAEMSMHYQPRIPISFQIGDVIDCNFGNRLEREFGGGHIHVIVCDIAEDTLVYVVPITKEKNPYLAKRFVPLIPDVDIFYKDEQYNGGTACVKMGRYVDPRRFRRVIGNIPETVLNLIYSEIQSAMNFKKDETEFSFDDDFDEPIDSL